MAQFVVRLDTGRMAEQLSKRSAAAVAARGDALGVQSVKIIENMIDSEVGTSGRAGQRGMQSLHDLAWDYRVIHPGDFPVTVEVSAQMDESTAAKFFALNSGHGPYVMPGPQAFESNRSLSGGRLSRRGNTVLRNVQRSGRGGFNWLRRAADEAKRRAAARF